MSLCQINEGNLHYNNYLGLSDKMVCVRVVFITYNYSDQKGLLYAVNDGKFHAHARCNTRIDGY